MSTASHKSVLPALVHIFHRCQLLVDRLQLRRHVAIERDERIMLLLRLEVALGLFRAEVDQLLLEWRQPCRQRLEVHFQWLEENRRLANPGPLWCRLASLEQLRA